MATATTDKFFISSTPNFVTIRAGAIVFRLKHEDARRLGVALMAVTQCSNCSGTGRANEDFDDQGDPCAFCKGTGKPT